MSSSASELGPNESSRAFIECVNHEAPTQRVIVDATRRTVTFVNCHQPRTGLGYGFETERVCDLDEILAVHDFLTGEHRGAFLRMLFFLGHLIHMPVDPGSMESIFVSTTNGRARIFAGWSGFAELRSRLREACSQRSQNGPWTDNPAFLPVFLIVIFAIVGGLIWLLL